MRTVIWLSEALEDLKIIGEYVAQDDSKVAYKIIMKIKATADSLSEYPEMGRIGRVKGAREMVVDGLPYILPYQVTDKDIRILAVLHTSRKWPESF